MGKIAKLSCPLVPLCILSGCSFFGPGHPDYIPDQSTATKIAEVVLEKHYGPEVLRQRPFKVKIDGGYWVIDGSTPQTPEGTAYVGGVAHIELNQRDGTIKNMIHGI